MPYLENVNQIKKTANCDGLPFIYELSEKTIEILKYSLFYPQSEHEVP
jgi:hypothetical protein